MTDLSTAREFGLILDFAFGMADRGIPLTLVSIAAREDSGGVEHKELAGLVADATRQTDRVAPDGQGGWLTLLMDCNRQGALIYADRILDRCGEWEKAHGPVACGIAAYTDAFKARDALV